MFDLDATMNANTDKSSPTPVGGARSAPVVPARCAGARSALPLALTLACLTAIAVNPAPLSAELTYGYVTQEVPAQSERVFGMPLDPAAVFTGGITAASQTDPEGNRGQISVAGSPWTPDAFGESGQASYLRVLTGSEAGRWYPITDNSADELTLDTAGDPDGSGLSALADGDVIAVFPHHTLDGLLPEGGGLQASSSTAPPDGDLLLLDLNAGVSDGINVFPERAFFYYDGASEGPAIPTGWYEIGASGGPHGSLPLPPDALFTVRTSANATRVAVQGWVPTGPRAQSLRSATAPEATDNRLFNPFPVPLSLAQFGLDATLSAFTATDSPFAPEGDRLLIYPAEATGENLPPAESYFFYSGAGEHFAPGWKREGNLAQTVDPADILLPPGASFVIRKSGATPADPAWILPTPYSLD